MVVVKNLVIASVGDRSRHQQWLQGREKPDFHLWLVYYGNTPGRYIADGAHYLQRPGGKWHNIFALTEAVDWSDYNFIFTPDDDLQMSVEAVNGLFRLASKYRLKLAQPAFTWDSLARWNITLVRPFLTLRWTNFTENGATLFSGDAFRLCRPTFHKSLSGFGLDLWWPRLLNYPENEIAILDEIPICHPPGESELDRLLPRETHRLEGDKLLKGLDLQPVREYGFLLNKSGREMEASGKTDTAIRSLAEKVVRRQLALSP